MDGGDEDGGSMITGVWGLDSALGSWQWSRVMIDVFGTILISLLSILNLLLFALCHEHSLGENLLKYYLEMSWVQ